ncbi:hypothetical protein [Paraburkholderia tropica]|uniref:hypothetical protein n=1 Tax=Paraburkholderia tropica TaxID=92647 RepID=UPI002AB76026|nr:hypothetical protein [Paraburkholderia tropica]
MGRPRKQIVEQIQQQAEALKSQTGDEAAATIELIADEAAEVSLDEVDSLLEQLTALATNTRHHCDMDRGAWLQVQLLTLINQIKAAL